jgi:Domain of unknown function (DUF4112)
VAPSPNAGAPMVRDSQLERLRRFAYWLDSGIRLPGTRRRIGLDPILGLVPGLGDAAGAVLATWFLVAGVRRAVSRATLARIAFNIAVDALIGAVPLLGDLFDFAWKANLRNVALLERQLHDPIGGQRADRLFVLLLVGTLFLVFLVLLLGSAILARWLIHVLSAHQTRWLS